MPIVVVPHPFGGLSLEAIQAKIDAVFPDLLKAATDWEPEITELPVLQSAYPAERFTFVGTVNDVNTMFFDKGWSLGAPIIPPTPELVEEMLTGTSRAPDDIVWDQVPPRSGVLTVELLATHAVMAGCKPEYMPLLIAVMEAMAEPDFNWRGASTTTGTAGVIVLVNGPIVEELGIASSTGAGGPGYHPNVSIGYAINLVGDIVGGSKSPDTDLTVLGAGRDIIAEVLGENVDALPAGWEPYHVEMGFNESDSVVTVKNVNPISDLHDGRSTTAEEWLTLTTTTIKNSYRGTSSIFLFPAVDEKGLLERDGWTKEAVKQFLLENTTNPYGKFVPGVVSVPEGLEITGPDTPIPQFRSLDNIHIFVTGGPGPHAHYAYWEHGSPVSKVIQK